MRAAYANTCKKKKKHLTYITYSVNMYNVVSTSGRKHGGKQSRKHRGKGKKVYYWTD